MIAIHSNGFRGDARSHPAGLRVRRDRVLARRDSRQPDIETYRAVLPALATTNGMLIGISTPYRKLGLLHQKHRDHFGVDDNEILVVQGTHAAVQPDLVRVHHRRPAAS